MNITFLDFSVIISSVIGYFIIISLLISPFYRNRANKQLSISLFLLTSISLLGWYESENTIFSLLQTIMWEMLVPVTLFKYFLIQIEHKFLNASWYKLLYLPFIITLVLDVFLHFNTAFDDEDFSVQILYFLEDNLSIVYNIILIFYARILIKRTNTLSTAKRQWLLRINLFIIFIIVVWILSDFEDNFLNSTFGTNLLWLLISFFSWWILYYGIFKLQLVTQKDEIHQLIILQKKTNTLGKNKKESNLNVINHLYQLMEDDELYKDPYLSRLDLAKELGISESNLSQIINKNINKSVVQFVNSYRIKAAKQSLSNPQFNKYAVEAIGMEAGFKSKSAFYSSFKTATGITPGAYKKLQKKS